MTDEQYDLLSIMLESKQLTHAELQNIHSSMDTFSEEDWSIIINWLHEKPNIPPKPMRRFTPARVPRGFVVHADEL